MKMMFSLFFFSLLVNCCDRINPKVPENGNVERNEPIIEFSRKVVDFGKISNDTILNTIFYLRNIGESELIIMDVCPECNCTQFILENDTIFPGDSTKLLVSFHTLGTVEGLQRKSIIIKSNTEKEYNTLFISYYKSTQFNASCN